MERILDKKLKPLGEKIEGLVKSVEFISSQYDELLIKHQNMEAINCELQKENELLRNEVLDLQNQSEQMWDKVDDLEQYGRRDCLEIRGIPVQKDENTDDLIISIGNLVNVNIKPEDISISHRLKSSTRSKFPPAIIAKFVRRDMKDKLYQARKHLKEKSTVDLGLGRLANNKIYIAESLTQKNKDLFNKILEMKYSMKYKFIWTVQGNIYLRKDSTTPKMLISSMRDLAILAQSQRPNYLNMPEDRQDK